MEGKKEKGKGGYRNIGGNNYGAGFDKNPQNINARGRPKSLLGKLNEKLKEEGFQCVHYDELTEFMRLLLGLPEKRVSQIAEDEDLPLTSRLMIADLTDPSSRFYVMKDMRDYVFGKATENKSIEIEVNENRDNIMGIDKNKLNEEQQRLLETILATE